MISVRDYQEYRSFITDWLSEQERNGWGFRTQLAKCMDCQLAYLSRVLKGNAHLSMEQGERLTAFFGFSKLEARHFMLLLQRSRAGTKALRSYFSAEIEDNLRTMRSLKTRLSIPSDVTKEMQSKYYSSWVNAAVHVAVSIPDLRTPLRIAGRLGLTATQVKRALQLLVDCGLVNEHQGKYTPSQRTIHLEGTSPHIAQHHGNWRLKALSSLQGEPKSEDLHYSGVMTLSTADAEKIREIIAASLAKINAILPESPDETLSCLCIDWFSL